MKTNIAIKLLTILMGLLAMIVWCNAAQLYINNPLWWIAVAPSIICWVLIVEESKVKQ